MASDRAAQIRVAAGLVQRAADAVSDLLRREGEPGPALTLVSVHADLIASGEALEHLARGFEAVGGEEASDGA